MPPHSLTPLGQTADDLDAGDDPLAPATSTRPRPWDVLVCLIALGIDLAMTLPLDMRDPFNRIGFPTTMLGIFAALLLRHRWPVRMHLVVLGLTMLLQVPFAPSGAIVSAFLSLFTVAARRPAREAQTALGLTGVALALMVYQMRLTGAVWEAYAFVPVFFGGIGLTAYAFGRRVYRSRLDAQAFSARLRTRGQEAVLLERARIARELHDILSHSVSAMMMQAAGARALMRQVHEDHPEDQRLDLVAQSLGRIEGTGSQSLRELHRLLDALRAGVDEEAPDVGGESQLNPGLASLDALVETPRRSGLVVEVHRSGEPGELDRSVDAAAYRVVQESLTNAMKHMGRGSVVDVFVTWRPSVVDLQVRSRAGYGSQPTSTPGSGTGLRGLEERVGLVGGTFGHGWVGDEFVTTAELPLRPSTVAARIDEETRRPA